MALDECFLREQFGNQRYIGVSQIWSCYVCTHSSPAPGFARVLALHSKTLDESQVSMSERSQPPEGCLAGNAPLRLQR
jgi:hypothetical protein